MADQLEPCPFCGGPSALDSNVEMFRVFCWNCSAKSNEFHSWQKAEAAWNRRAQVVPTEQQIAKYLWEKDCVLTPKKVARPHSDQPYMNEREVQNVIQAAAPKPPEAQRSENLTIKNAPMELPEPVAAQSRVLPNGGWGWCTVEHARFAKDWANYETRVLYTEEHVRTLLASHPAFQTAVGCSVSNGETL